MFKSILKNQRKTVGRWAVLSALAVSQLSLTAQTINWAPAGPVTTPSRIRSIIIDNQVATGNKLYAGSVTGGLFESSDGGLNWSPLTDQATVKNISCLAESPSGVIYVGTGENYARASQLSKLRPGTGLYTYSNGNLNLVAGTAAFGNINKIVFNPNNGQRIYVASATGLYVSTDGGATWASGTTSGTVTGQAFDVALASNGIAYASIGNISGGTKVYQSANGDPGSFTTDVTPTVAIVSGNYGRIELAIPKTNPNKLYVSCASPFAGNNSFLQGLFVYDNISISTTPVLILEGSAQLDPLRSGNTGWGDYSHTLLVDPLNEDALWVGGYGLWRWTKSGTTPGIGNWVRSGTDAAPNTFLYLPKNTHQFAFKPNDPNTIYVATDGSVYKTTDRGFSFIGAYKGLNATSFNNIAIIAKPNNAAPYVPQYTLNGVVYPGNGGTPISGQQSGYVASGVSSGVTYYNGSYPNIVGQEDYNTGEFNNVVISKILPKASVVTKADGTLWRTSDYTTQEFAQFNVRSSVAAANANNFVNASFSVTGTPFSLFEKSKFDNAIPACDSALFYNDIVGLKFAILTATNAPNANAPLAFQNERPQASALYDSIVIVTSNAPGSPTCSAVTPQTIQVVPSYATPTSNPTFAVLTGASTSTANNFITMDFNPTTKKDNLSFQFLNAPGPSTTSCPGSTLTPKVDVNVKIYYKYLPGSTVSISNNDISTITLKETATLTVLKSHRGGANNSPVKVAWPLNNRLAFATNRGIFVSRNMFDFGDAPSTHMISGPDTIRIDGAGGAASNSTVVIPNNARVKFLQWSPTGQELYVVRASQTGTTTTSHIYRISHLVAMYDSSFTNYGGRFNTASNIYKAFNAANPGISTLKLNPNSPFRTTLIGRVDSVITGMTIKGTGSNYNLILTAAPSGTGSGNSSVYLSSSNPRTANTATNMSNFSGKTGNLPNTLTLYTSLSEINNSDKVFLGTSNGIWMTNDISQPSPTWSNAGNNQIPNIEVYDLKQQTISHWQSHNSGVIFATTNGRGIWRTDAFYTQSYIGVDEISVKPISKSLHMYPNPSNGTLNFDCKSIEGETLIMEIIDITGRVVLSENLGKALSKDVTYTTQLNDLNNGIYVVNVRGDKGSSHIGKLILSK
jgi:hypothetical protein